MTHNYKNRLKTLHLKLQENNLDTFIVTARHDIFYLTGLYQLHPSHREAILIVTPKKTHLHHSSFLIPPQHSWLSTSTMPKNRLEDMLTKITPDKASIGIQAQDLTVSELNRFKHVLNTSTFLPHDQLLKDMRYHKHSSELKAITKAIDITQKTMDWIIDDIKTNFTPYTEIELQHRINQHLIEQGAQDTAFPTLVAFNAHSASPHHIATDTKLTPDSVVLLDFGARYAGYCSDMTRTCKLGQPDPKFQQIEDIVHQAYQAAIDTLKPLQQGIQTSIPAADIDQAARSVISEAGHAQHFIHTTGHGLGLDIHEAPSLSSKNDQHLEKNMAITIEPGIYLQKTFGYRHENTIII